MTEPLQGQAFYSEMGHWDRDRHHTADSHETKSCFSFIADIISAIGQFFRRSNKTNTPQTPSRQKRPARESTRALLMRTREIRKKSQIHELEAHLKESAQTKSAVMTRATKIGDGYDLIPGGGLNFPSGL